MIMINDHSSDDTDEKIVLVLVPGIQDEAGDKMMIGTMMISCNHHDNIHGSDEKRVLVLVHGKYPSRKEG